MANATPAADAIEAAVLAAAYDFDAAAFALRSKGCVVGSG
jgi:hypothetical protein